jgi:hypothetical protein
MSEIGTPPAGGKSQTQDVQLRTILAISEVASEIEGQDQQYQIEMLERMLTDLIFDGDIAPPRNYVRHYVDAMDPDEFMTLVEGRIQENMT